MSEEAVVQGTSPLRPARPSPDSVQMEVIWARCPLNDAEINDTVWSEIDETQVAPAVQRELARNGFRVGVIGGTPPDAIARVLNMEAAEPPTAERRRGAFNRSTWSTRPRSTAAGATCVAASGWRFAHRKTWRRCRSW